jgi:hypothetical protein
MEVYNEKVWVIMSKDGKMVAKGTPRNRCLVAIKEKNKLRFLTYSSKGMAEAGFRNNWFYGAGSYKPEDLEAVECNLTLNTL